MKALEFTEKSSADTLDFLNAFEQSNCLQRYRRYENEGCWCWGVLGTDKFQVMINTDSVSQQIVDGKVVLCICGSEITLPCRIHIGGSLQLKTCLSGEPWTLKLRDESFVAALPPTDILDITNFSKFQFHDYERFSQGYIVLRFGEEHQLSDKLNTYVTSDSISVIADVLERLRKVMFLMRN